MEESFRVRVDKVFGSLLASSSSSTPSSSLWCLTDEEVERREWNGATEIRIRKRDNSLDHEHESSYHPSNLDGFIVSQQQNKSSSSSSSSSSSMDFKLPHPQQLQHTNNYDYDYDYDYHQRNDHPSSSDQQSDSDIRSSIGLDSTLDLEEEEDEHDKVAVGREKVCHPLYMNYIADYGIELSSYSEFPTTTTTTAFKDVNRDPRPNHLAAKIRLKEDAKPAEQFDSLRLSDYTVQSAVDVQDNIPEDGVSLKSILKRKKANELDPKLQKNAVFEQESQGAKGLAMETCSMIEDRMPEEACVLRQDHSGVPDYVRNPWRYTRYTFDSLNDIDEESNRKAYMDFLNMIKRSNTSESQQPDDTLIIDHPKAITFTPKKKPGDKSTVENGNDLKQNQVDVCKDKKDWRITIVTGDAEEDDVCAMEEDELGGETIVDTTSNWRRPSRQYRTKAKIELDEPVT